MSREPSLEETFLAQYGHDAGQYHLSQASLSRDINAARIVGAYCTRHKAGVLPELTPHFLYNVAGRFRHS